MTALDFAYPALLIRNETAGHVAPREMLLDAAFGPTRFEKTCERLREGRLPAEDLALVAEEAGRLIGTVRLWHVTLGPNRPGLLLGPVAVDSQHRSAGIGALLMREAIARAADMSHRAIVLVGDAPYYERFGFSAAKMSRLWLPGPVERERFLGLELEVGALDGAAGLVAATGAFAPRVWPNLPEARLAA